MEACAHALLLFGNRAAAAVFAGAYIDFFQFTIMVGTVMQTALDLTLDRLNFFHEKWLLSLFSYLYFLRNPPEI